MIKYKIDILRRLKEAGYSTYLLRNDKILHDETIQKLRRCELVSWNNINTICKLLNCQPGDLLYFTDEFEMNIKEE